MVTKISQTVVGSNVITDTTIANNSILARHVSNASIEARHLSDEVNILSVSANVDIVQDNVTALTSNVDIVQDNISAILDTSTNLAIASGLYFFDKSTGALGIGNATPIESSLTFGSPAQMILNYGAEANLLINTSNPLTGFSLDVRGSANVGAFNSSSVNVSGLTASRVVLTDASKNLQSSTITVTELGYLSGVSSNIQSQLDNLSSTVSLIDVIQDNVNVVQDNVSSILDGTSSFTGPVTMQNSLTIEGNLIVLGAQVDLGVISSQIYDEIILLSANLDSGTPPPGDSGILINRGLYDNVFIGVDSTKEHIDFIFTDSPGDNIEVAIKSFIELHANAFHASNSSITNVPFAMYGDLDTGLHFPENDKMSFVTNGVIKANVTSTGNIELTSGFIEGPENSFDLDDDSFGGKSNSVTLRSKESVGVFLNYSSSSTGDWFGVYANEDDPGQATIDSAFFYAKEDEIKVQGNANVQLDLLVQNSTFSSSVFSSGVELRANDYITFTQAVATARANDFSTYTVLNSSINTVNDNVVQVTANLNVLQDNVNLVQDNVTALTGGGILLSPFHNVNTSTGTSNCFFIGKNIITLDNVQTVALDGVVQTRDVPGSSNNDFIFNSGNNTIQFTEETIPSGLTVLIDVFFQ